MSYTSLFFGAFGRFSRSQYWAGLAMCVFLLAAANIAESLFASDMPRYGVDVLAWPTLVLGLVLRLYTLYLLATVHVRRLHDMGHPGLYALLAAVTVVGIVPLVAMSGLFRGEIGSNRFGPDPLFDPVDAAAVFSSPRRKDP